MDSPSSLGSGKPRLLQHPALLESSDLGKTSRAPRLQPFWELMRIKGNDEMHWALSSALSDMHLAAGPQKPKPSDLNQPPEVVLSCVLLCEEVLLP